MINSTTSTKTYTPSFVYNENILEYALFEEGRLLKDANGIYEYQYFLKDHLGNTRVTFSGNTGLIQQQDHYYPFGMNFSGIANAQAANIANQYKYNGKELQADLDLNWYDYGARFYDPQGPRFLTIDPLAEKYYGISPYAYVANNPMRFIDPDGQDFWDFLRGVKNGALESAKSTAQGLANLAQAAQLGSTQQIEMAMATANIIENPRAVVDGVKQAISNTIQEVRNDKTGEKAGELVGNIGVQVGLAFATTKGLDKLAKVGKIG